MNLKPIPKQGTTAARKRFWDNVAGAVLSARKIAGRNVSVSEFDSGSLIDVNPQRDNRQGTVGACCVDDVCIITAESGCTEAGGIFQGIGTICDPNPCGGAVTGACCIDGECSQLTEVACGEAGGSYRGDGTSCSAHTCCLECTPDVLVGPPCTDFDGNCWTGIDSGLPAPQCFGSIIPCDSQWLRLDTICVCGGGTCFQYVDHETCELIDTCATAPPCDPCEPEGDRRVQDVVSDQYFPCP